MKKLFTLLVLTLLSACIEVGEMSGIWEQATVDSALEGTWKMVGHNEAWSFVKNKSDYLLTKIEEGKNADASDARSITYNHRTFLLIQGKAPQTGLIMRFDKKENFATQYDIKHVDAFMEWIKNHHPENHNFVLANQEMFGPRLKILTLDAPTLALFSEVPDALWTEIARYKKQ